MPKELFNQTLVISPDLPADDERFVFGLPGVSAGKNIKWSRLREMFGESLGLTLSDPVNETFDGGVTVEQSNLNKTIVSRVLAAEDSIKQISGAAIGLEADPKPQSITTAELPFTFIESIATTNPDIITVDELNNQVTIKEDGIYQFNSFLNVSNASASQGYDLTLRTRDVSDDTIITERTLTIGRDGYSGSSTFTFEIGPSGPKPAPVTIKFSLQGTHASNLQLEDLQTSLLTGQASVGGGLASIAESSNLAIRAITGYSNGVDIFNYNSGGLYEFDSIETAPDDDDLYLTPNDITGPSPGRWVLSQVFNKAYNDAKTFKRINDHESLTADRTITWQDKSITPAGLLDTSLINSTFNTGTTDADPGAGNFRYNNVTQSAATFIYINGETGLNAAITIEMLDSLKNGATIKLECLTDPAKWAVLKLSANAINASTYTKLPLTVINKGTDFASSDQVAFVLLNAGGGGAAERENTTTVVAADSLTTTIDFSAVEVETLDVSNGVTDHTIAVSNLSTTERYNTLVIDNADNLSGLTVVFDDQTGAVQFRGAKNDFPGTYPNMNVPAETIWNVSFENRSATLAEVSFYELEDY